MELIKEGLDRDWGVDTIGLLHKKRDGGPAMQRPMINVVWEY